MLPRLFRTSALICSLGVAACGDGSGILGVSGSADAATVRFVNATASALDLAVGGSVSTANANITPGGGVACFTIDDPSVPGLSVRQAGSTTDLGGFTPFFSSGGRYTIVAFPGAAGTVQFINVPNAAAIVSGRSALRVLNASSGLGTVDVHATAVGATLGTPNVTGVGFGNASGTFDVPAGAVQVRLTSSGTTNVVFDAGTQTFEAEKSYTLVVSSATAAVLVPDC
jgi:hypothetical protein